MSLLNGLPIGEILLNIVKTVHFSDLFCAGRIPEDDMNRVMAACGGTVLTTVSNITEDVLGKCELFYEEQVGSERFVFFQPKIMLYFSFNIIEGCSKTHSCTLILRGGAEQFIAETERSLHDAIMIVRRAKKNDAIVAGGGAIEMELCKHLREVAKTIPNKEQFFWRAYAKAFEVIPQQLCFNAGLDGVDILNQLRTRHQKGNKWDGVDIHKEEASNNFDGCVWEPALTKENAIISATEAACTILSIDQTVKNPRRKNEISGAQQALHAPH
jgi:T-complex protein 1 subunit eta